MKRPLVILQLAVFVLISASAQEPERIRLTFIGDIMAHLANYRIADFHDVYKGLEPIFRGDDLTFANLEFPVDPSRPLAGYPQFNGSRDNWTAAVDSGVDVFSLANNHSYDQGVQGILQTLRSAAAVRGRTGQPVYVSGIRGNVGSPFQSQVMEIKGVRIGYLAATQFINQFIPCPYVNVMDYMDAGAADRFIAYVAQASRSVDVFIVSYHCGIEFAPGPSPGLARFFKRLAENGVLIVHGHHPHVLQSPYTLDAGGELRVVLPSMGNFISGMAWYGPQTLPPPAHAPAGDSALVQVELVRYEGKVHVDRIEALPTANYGNANGEIVVGKLGELAEGKPGLSPMWTNYFKGRLAYTNGLLGPFATQGDIAGGG
jgi:poly-gamma-glutamate synthesis protein (capsule biosynthesis protein)